MQSLAQGGYTHKQVLDQLLYSDGSRNINFRYALLNEFDVPIADSLSVSGGSVRHASLSEIKRTAMFTLKETEFRDIDYSKERIQPYFRLQMTPRDWLEWSLGIFLISSPVRKEQNGHVFRELNCDDSSVMLVEDKFTDRHLIRHGSNYVNAIRLILNSAKLQKINIESNDALTSRDIEFEIGMKKSEAVNDLLDAINYTSYHVDEAGYVTAKPYVSPSNTPAGMTYETDDLSVIAPGAENELDTFDIPNIFIAVATNPETDKSLKSKYTNNDPMSMLSTVRRGRNVVRFDELSDIADQATLDSYIQRIAFEASQVYDKVRFTTAAMPHHGYMDVLNIKHKILGISERYSETAWEMNLNTGSVQMTHEVRRILTV